MDKDVKTKSFFNKPYFILFFLMIVLFVIDMATGRYLTQNGGAVYPRELSHISGIFFSTLLHANVAHISANSLPFLVLGWFLKKTMTDGEFYLMFAFITIFSGLMVWIMGSPSFHLGASSVIFGMWSLILYFAFIRRTFKDILIGTLIFFTYGFTFVFGLIPQEGISFAGHFWGLVGGVLFGWLFLKSEKIEHDLSKK